MIQHDTPEGSRDGESQRARWFAAGRAATLIAIDPSGLGGVHVRSAASPVRDRWLDLLGAMTEGRTNIAVAGVGPKAEDLDGGLDLLDTLACGKPMYRSGLRERAQGGFVTLRLADRLTTDLVPCFLALMDGGDAPGVIACDEAMPDEEGLDPAVEERLGLTIFLDGLRLSECVYAASDHDAVVRARALMPKVVINDGWIEEICALTEAFAIASMRAAIFAVQAAKVSAAYHGRTTVKQEDVELATALVLLPRARRLPAPEEAPEEDQGPPESESAEQNETEDRPQSQTEPQNTALADQLVEAAAYRLPPGFLLSMAARSLDRRGRGEAGRARGRGKALGRGRPQGVEPIRPRDRHRLSVIETLRAAAPWQKIRARTDTRAAERRPIKQPLRVTKDDLRAVRRKAPERMTTIFVVDASGSHAVGRMAQAKGAVLAMLSDCYVRRDEVALIAFRGEGADLLLPPTPSPARASRALQTLPGGGGTPLAAGLEVGLRTALRVRREGKMPILVLLSDGRANVARSGAQGRARADEDAHGVARMLRAEGIKCAVIDTALRRGQHAKNLAETMGADYHRLPGHAVLDPEALKTAVS